jgi:PAS domain S-box-containing protein
MTVGRSIANDDVLAALGAAVLFTDADGTILDASTTALEWLSTSLDELAGRPAASLWTDGRASSDPNGSQWPLPEGTPVKVELVVAQGAPLVVEVRALPSSEGGGSIALVIRDITELKRAEKALVESEERFRAVADFAYDWEAWNAPNGSYIYVSPSCERITGHTAPEFLSDPDLTVKITHPDDVAASAAHHELALIEGQDADLELDFRIVTPDGDVRWVNHLCSPVYDQHGTWIGRRESNRDITDRKLAQAALADARWRLQSIIEGTNVGTWEWNVQTDQSVLNEKWAEIIGYTLEELQPTGVGTEERFAHPDDLAYSDEQLARHFAGEIPYYDCELRLRHKDGHWVWVHDRGRVVTWTDDGQPLMMFGTHTDITQRKLAESELERHAEQLTDLLDEREHHLEQLGKSLSSIIEVVGQVVETRDPYTAGHQRRVSELAVGIAQEMGLSADDVEEIRIAGLIHDVGKVSVPAEILSKPGRLSDMEFELVKAHAEAGYKIIASANMAGPTAEMVYEHHERCDGSGYPRGLKGSDLLLGSRVLMVADVVEAMCSHRPHRAGLASEEALDEIRSGSGTIYDSGAVEACLRLFLERQFEFSEV